MHLEQLRLVAFRCLKKAELTCGRLTILTGPNSGGKSSLLAGILGALQSPQFPLLLSSHGKYVDLGDYSSLVYRHQRDANVSVGLTVSDGNAGAIGIDGVYESDVPTGLPRAVRVAFASDFLRLTAAENTALRFAAKYSSNPAHFPAARAVGGEEGKKFVTALQRLILDGMPQDKGKEKSRRKVAATLEQQFQPRAMEGRLGFRRLQDLVPQAKTRDHWLASEIEHILGATKRFDSTFNYVSSFRYAPARVYAYSPQPDLKVGRYGDNVVQQIAAWQNEGSPRLRHLGTFLRKLTLVSRIETRRLRGGRFELIVRPFAKSSPASLPDVGFGISQFLPIAVADVQLPRGSTLAVSQPEIHLHPSVQAELGTALVDRMVAEDRRYIVETHSEYFLNRVRLLIAEGRIAPEDVSTVYVENAGAGAVVHQLRLEKDGRIVGAPKSFFETYMMDVMNIAARAEG